MLAGLMTPRRMRADRPFRKTEWCASLCYRLFKGGRILLVTVAAQSTETVERLRLAAEQGDAGAQFGVGFMYYDGNKGVPQDYQEAVRWYRLAAEQGYATAQFHLGVMYYNGEGVPQDDQEAARWFRLAAEQGIASAQ